MSKNANSSVLKIGDGIINFGDGTVAVTREKHLAMRNAIIQHREGDREPLAIEAERIRRENLAEW